VPNTEGKTVEEKRGKTKQAKPRSTPKQGAKTTYIVPIKDFTILAEYVANKSDPPIQVPINFGARLDRAIWTREWFFGEISAHLLADDVETQQSDERHEFFLGVLRSVRTILTPRYAKTYTPIQQTPMSEPKLRNMFANLKVEEPSETLQEATAVPTSAPTSSGVQYQAVRDKDDEEQLLAFKLILCDICRLRDEVTQIWKSYSHGALDLVTASITTNTAVDLARSLERAYQHMFPDCPDMGLILSSVLFAMTVVLLLISRKDQKMTSTSGCMMQPI